MANPITGFQLAQQGVNLSPSSSATRPAAQQKSSTSKKKPIAPPIYRYPLEKMLEDYTDYIKITSLVYRPPGVGELNSSNFVIPTSDTNYQSINKKDIMGTILLPMPQNIPNNSQSANWGEGTLNPITAAGVEGAQNIINSPNFFAGAAGEIGNFITRIKNAAETGQGQKTIQNYFAAAAVQALTGQGGEGGDLFTNLLARGTGAIINENVELLFRGVNLRAPIELSFDLAPRDDKEAQEIRNIILLLKRDMSPKKGNTNGAAGGLFITAPNVFKVEYMSGKKNHPYLNRYKICALQGLNLNFTASNTYTTYSDGTPVHMNLGLTFQELTPIYYEDYDSKQNPEAFVGVGY